MTKKVSSMQRISLYAPSEPRNDIIATMIPVAINIDAEATYKLLPSSRSINDLSAKVHTPTANTINPPSCQKQIICQSMIAL